MTKKITFPCLSVQQPFADLICGGIKTVENRTWNTDYRGSILIHASTSVKPAKAYTMAMNNPAFKIAHDEKFGSADGKDFNYEAIAEDPEALRQLAMVLKWLDANDNATVPPMRTGAIIGMVDIVDVIPPTGECDNAWSVDGNYRWVLADPVFLTKPILYQKGKLKLYSQSIDFDLKTIDLLEWYFGVFSNTNQVEK